jgi:hypothetical protein
VVPVSFTSLSDVELGDVLEPVFGKVSKLCASIVPVDAVLGNDKHSPIDAGLSVFEESLDFGRLDPVVVMMDVYTSCSASDWPHFTISWTVLSIQSRSAHIVSDTDLLRSRLMFIDSRNLSRPWS